MKRVKSARRLQRFVSIHDPIANLLNVSRHDIPSAHHRQLRAVAMELRRPIARLARAGDLDDLLEPIVFVFLFDIGHMEADGAFSRSRHSVVTRLCDAGSRGAVKRLIVND